MRTGPFCPTGEGGLYSLFPNILEMLVLYFIGDATTDDSSALITAVGTKLGLLEFRIHPLFRPSPGSTN